MVEPWELVSNVANVGQLTGLNALELTNWIGVAANNVRTHKSKCLRFLRWLELRHNALKPIMADTALMKNPETSELLKHLEDKLRGAVDLVSSFQNRNYLYLLAAGRTISREFKESQKEIEGLLHMIPLVKMAAESKDKMDAIEGFKILLREAVQEAEMDAIEGFKILLREAVQEAEDITSETEFNKFAIQCGNDERFKNLDRKERKRLFNERVDELVKAAFKRMLLESGDINSNSCWLTVCDSLRSDPRYKAVKIADREAFFNEHVAEMRSAEQNTESTVEATSKEEVENNARFYMPKWLGKMKHRLQKFKPTCLCKRC